MYVRPAILGHLVPGRSTIPRGGRASPLPGKHQCSGVRSVGARLARQQHYLLKPDDFVKVAGEVVRLSFATFYMVALPTVIALWSVIIYGFFEVGR